MASVTTQQPGHTGRDLSLLSTEEQYRTLVLLAPDVLYSLAEDGSLTALSPSFEDITGWPVGDWLGKSFAGLIHPEDLPLALAKFQHASGGEIPDAYEVRVRTKSGDYLVGEIRSIPKFEAGRVVGTIGIARDVTESKTIETIERQLAAIVESSEDAIIGKTLDSIITSWNPGAERLYVYTAGEAVGNSIAMLVPPERPDELPGIMNRLKRGERIHHYETVRVKKDGSHLEVSLSISPIRAADGTITGAATIARDIGEQKKAERERARLLEAEQTARRRAEVIQGNVTFLARASEILAGSLDYQTTLGNVARLAVPYLGDWCTIDLVEDDGRFRRIALSHPDPEKVDLARRLQEKYPPNEQSSEAVMQVVRTGESVLVPEITPEALDRASMDDEQRTIIKGLGLRSYLVVPLPARGRILGVISFVFAESDRRYGAEEQSLAEDLGRRAAIAVDNARLYLQAQEALQLRNEFLSIASHELKTPLTSLQLQVQILERVMSRDMAAPMSSERAQHVLAGAQRQVKRLSKLINDLLDVSRIAAGKVELELATVELGELVSDVIERFRSEAATVGSPIALHVETNVVGSWDPFRIDQVVTNLLSNAIKYGLGNPIDVTVAAASGTARLCVVDHGIGIALDDLTRIFDRFERMTSVQSYGGLGLGLYIARQIVDAHGGTIGVSSEPSCGSTFTVELPLAS
jgi:PAS domain S-box-containing protein